MNELNDFFNAIAKAKAEDPKHKVIKDIKESVANDISSLFEKLESAVKPVEVIAQPEVIEEIVEEVKEVVSEEKPITQPKTPEEMKSDVEKYLKDLPKDSHSFQQPLEQPISNDIKAITSKLKFLEQAVGKIAATGPGSGEVNFRWLDDVNRASINDNWVLEYDAASKKFQFTEHIGAIRSVKFNTTGPQSALVAGQMAYNPDEDCFDFRHEDGTTLQGGLENHIRVHNHLSETLTNGTVVQFAGVENTNSIAMPIIGKYLADSNAAPLFLIGVLTTDIAPGAIGRATVFGYVRNLNTTGSDVGETWVQGDLLWAHPTQAGKLTKFRPTAPNVATSIAAVARLSATDGQLLVRPTIWPRLYYGDWYDTTNQVAALPNTPYAVKLSNSTAVSGFELNSGGTVVKALNAGRYNFEFSLQVTSTNSSLARIWIWYRKNGVDAPNSATVVTVRENGGKLAPAWNFPVLMDANDTFTLMWATESTNVSLAHEPATSFCPAIPSVILTVSQTNL